MTDQPDPKEFESRLPLDIFIKPILNDNDVKSSMSTLSFLSLMNQCDKTSPGFSKDFIELIMHEIDINTPFSYILLNAWVDQTTKIEDPEFESVNKSIEAYRKTLKILLSQLDNQDNYFRCIKFTVNVIKEVKDSWKRVSEKYFVDGKNADYKKSLNESRQMFLSVARRISNQFKITIKNPNVRMIIDMILLLTFRLQDIVETYNKLVL